MRGSHDPIEGELIRRSAVRAKRALAHGARDPRPSGAFWGSLEGLWGPSWELSGPLGAILGAIEQKTSVILFLPVGARKIAS